MNAISSHTETKTETVITETNDGHGNIVQTETTVTRTYLYIIATIRPLMKWQHSLGLMPTKKSSLMNFYLIKINPCGKV